MAKMTFQQVFNFGHSITYVHSKINWILFGCSPLHVVALILDAVCALAFISDATFRTIRVLHYAYKVSRNPILKFMKWKLVGLFLTRHSSLCPKGKKKSSGARPGGRAGHTMLCPSPIALLRNYTCSQLRIARVLWQVAPSRKNHTLRMAPLRWSPISHVRLE